MHDLRALLEWYYIVHWSSLIRIQDINRVGPQNILSVNILILNHGGQITLRGPIVGCMVTPSGPWTILL